MKDLATLNPQQKEAVTITNKNLLVLAGAGSGKTRVITYKIAYLIDKGVYPQNILALTFTNKAAKEMKERISFLTGRQLKNLQISTFHSFCVKILRKEIHNIGYTNNFVIYDENESIALIKRIAREEFCDKKFKERELYKIFSYWKNQLKSPKKLEIEGEDEIYIYLYREYLHRLKLLNALDFDDLLIKTIEIFIKFPNIKKKYQEQYKYILVDEYQDTNDIQLLFLKKIYKEGNNICVVGDDDQSIYTWRGANVNHILEFERYFPNVKVIKLEQNYRSTNIILEAANSIILKNSVRKSKKLWSNKKRGEKIRVFIGYNGEEEVKLVVDEIVKLIRVKNIKPENIAILYRSNHQSRPFEMELRYRNIPYNLIGGRKLFDKTEIKDMISYLKVFLNPYDEISLLRIINIPHRGIGKNSLEKIINIARRENRNIWDILENIDNIQINLPSYVKRNITIFVNLVKKYQKLFSQNMEMSKIFDNFLKEINYYEYLYTFHGKKDEDKQVMNRWTNILLLRETLKKQEEKERITLKDFITNVTIDDMTKEEKEIKKGKVVLLTIHSAKGLEFDYVFLVGMEEGLLPHKNSFGNIEEERRLCYVAITRAREKLYISYAKNRMRYGKLYKTEKSRFLKDIPEKLLTFSDLSENEERKLSFKELFYKKYG